MLGGLGGLECSCDEVVGRQLRALFSLLCCKSQGGLECMPAAAARGLPAAEP